MPSISEQPGPTGSHVWPARVCGVEILDAIADERRRTADFLDGLTEAQLRTPSLCSAWTVRDVAAHLLMPLVTPIPRVLTEFVLSGLNFHGASRRLTARVAARSTQELAEGLRAQATHPFHPPGLPHTAPLTDLLIHGQDMRRPLGLTYQPEPERIRVGLDFLVSSKARGFVSGRRLTGVRYDASDLDWSYGDGPALRGPGLSLMLALTGRNVALDDLHGDGVDALRALAH